jgi:signal transduction histidine kinase
VRLEAQISERQRIARDLHDSFFQGIEGFLLHLHVVTSRLRLESETSERIRNAFSEADAVMAQGRSLIFELRTQIVAGDLVKAIEASIDQVKRKPELRLELHVFGAPRKLAAYPCEEISKIVREAIWNAIRHANGNYIEVAIHYSRSSLNVSVEDDGVGIAPDILSNGGRPGHWGLLGIRERAQKLGAQLEIDSSAHGGARICLRVTSAKAYESLLRRLAARLFSPSGPAK